MEKRIKSFGDFIKESIGVEHIPSSSYEKTTVERLPYSSKIAENRIIFQKKLVQISKNLGINPKWLMVLIKDLSNFNSKFFDENTRSAGLIKFFPGSLNSFIDTNTGKNIRTKDLPSTNNTDQLDLIYAYFKAWFDKLGIEDPVSPGDFISLIFYPPIINKDWKSVFPDSVVRANNEFFGKIEGEKKTKKDFYEYIEKILRDPKETEAENMFGQFSGAMFDPYTYRSKEALDRYEKLVSGFIDYQEMEDAAREEETENNDINYEETN